MGNLASSNSGMIIGVNVSLIEGKSVIGEGSSSGVGICRGSITRHKTKETGLSQEVEIPNFTKE